MHDNDGHRPVRELQTDEAKFLSQRKNDQHLNRYIDRRGDKRPWLTRQFWGFPPFPTEIVKKPDEEKVDNTERRRAPAAMNENPGDGKISQVTRSTYQWGILHRRAVDAIL